MTDASSLPQDLVDEIFVRVPATFLVRFKVLSKHYGSLISNPKFVSTNFRLHTSQSLILTSSEDERHKSLTIHGTPDGPLEHIDVDGIGIEVEALVGSVNGLVCLRGHSTGENCFVVLNPATKRYKRIPFPSDAFDTVGFGYGIHDYKLVAIPNRLVPMPVQVFSLKIGTWKNVPFDVTLSNRLGLSADHHGPASLSVSGSPKVLNGVWYRLVAEDQYILQSYDLEEDCPSWTSINAPLSFTADLELGHYNDEKLCVFAIDKWFQNKEGSIQFDMWVMEEGGLWEKMFSTNLVVEIASSLRTRYRVCGTWQGTPAILSYELGSDAHICVYSPLSHRWRRVDGRFSNRRFLDACDYSGSLLPLQIPLDQPAIIA